MSQKKRFRGIAVLVMAIVAAGLVTAIARRGSKETPPLQDLSSTEQLKQRFQQDSGNVRLIALVSPICPECRRGFADMQRDRKSTRLNSSHLVISYAVFCLKKKNSFRTRTSWCTPLSWQHPRPHPRSRSR